MLNEIAVAAKPDVADSELQRQIREILPPGAQVRTGLAQAAEELHPVHAGHLDIEKEEIRGHAPQREDRRAGITVLADHPNVFVRPQQVADPGASERLVVHDGRANGHRAAPGTGANAAGTGFPFCGSTGTTTRPSYRWRSSS